MVHKNNSHTRPQSSSNTKV